MDLVAGIHCSSSATEVELFDVATGRSRARSVASHPSTSRPDRPGCSEADPVDWWAATRTAISTALESARRDGALSGDGQLTAIAVAAMRAMVPLDAAGAVIRPAKLSDDAETAPDAGWLLEQLPGGADEWLQACGRVPSPGSSISALSWLHRSEPDAWRRLTGVATPQAWLTCRLTGALVTDSGDASGTGYWDATEGRYRHDLLAIVDRDRDWTTALPPVRAAHERAGVVVAEAGMTDEVTGSVVAVGTGHEMALEIASGSGAVVGAAVLAACALTGDDPADVVARWALAARNPHLREPAPRRRSPATSDRGEPRPEPRAGRP
jgi:xylulokinase